MHEPSEPILHLALPKGRMQTNVVRLLADASLHLRESARSYRPTLSAPGYEVKLQKPQSILEMLHAGTRDLGFAGADWVAELGVDVVELLDTGLDPVRIVVAAPKELVRDGALSRRPLTIASEYERLTQAFLARRDCGDRFVRSYGATEVFPPEDADAILDNSATGTTLQANGLVVVEEIVKSSTRLYASRRAMADAAKVARIDGLVLLLRSVLDARLRVMLEVNVAPSNLAAIVAVLPCMREPTVSPLHGGAGYAVKAAVPRAALASLIPALRARGGADVVVTELIHLAT